MGVAKYTKDEKDQITRCDAGVGHPCKTSYGPEDLERIGFSYEKDLADPGDVPLYERHPSLRLQEQGLDNAAVYRLRHPFRDQRAV